MISPDTVTSYAQYNEDIILAALLSDVNNGFYIDVGANDPVIDSVTKYFYDRGWSGINIEPLKKYASKFSKLRKRDINLGYGVGKKNGTAMMREYKHIPGHSTFDSSQKDNHDDFIEYSVEIKTLERIIKDNKVKTIDFLKIDVEGYEYDVIAGNNWEICPPKVLYIESNHGTKDWKTIITSYGYRLFIQDGLNEYYVHDKHWYLTENFAERVILLDYNTLKLHQRNEWNGDIEQLKQENNLLAAQNTNLQTYVNLSLYNKHFIDRVMTALKGLTIDYYNFKRGKKD